MFGKLTIFDSSGRNPLAHTITQQFTYVGKDKDCDIRFENSNCAGKQFLLTVSGNGPVKIQNLSKKYATQVNQKPIGFQVDHDLNEQDTISAAGRKINWSYKTSAAEDLPQNGALKRTRNSEPVRKVAVVTPNRRETIVNEEEGLPLKRRRYVSSVDSFTPHRCTNIAFLPKQSSFERRISYDRMLKGKATPSNRGRLSSGTTPRRLAGSLGTPSGSAQKNKKLTFASTLEVYNHDTAFNKSITPRTFYSGRSSNAPFTFRGFNSVAEESSSSILPQDSCYSSINESIAIGRRSGRVSTPVPKKRLTPSFHSARTSRNRSILTGTPSVYFPTIQEGTLLESGGRRSTQLRESYLYENSGTLVSPLNDPNYGRGSTPASYFSPTSSGSPRMMRAESPNIQHDANGVPRSPYQGRRSLVSSGRSTSFGTPQEVFHQGQQHDSLFVNTSGSSQIRQRRSRGSFLDDQRQYGSHESILQSPQSQTFNTPARLNTPRRSRSVIETPGSSSFSPMSYNDTDYVLLSPRGRNLVSKRFERSDHSGFSQSPYSPSQNTLDFTASPPQHQSPRFARTPKRSLSIQVLTRSLQMKANYDFNRSNVSSPKGRKSKKKSRVNLSRSASTPVLASPTQDPSTDLLINNEESVNITAHHQSIVVGSDSSMLDSDSEPSKRRTPRRSLGEGNRSTRVSRRSQSVPSGSPTPLNSSGKSRKSGNRGPKEILTPGARQSPKQSGSPAQANSSRKSRKSVNVGSEEISTPGTRQSPKRSGQSGSPAQANSTRKSRKSGNVGSEEISTPGARQSPKRSGQSGSPAQANSTRKSRKSGNVGSEEISTPGARQLPKRFGQSGSPAQANSTRKSRKSGNVGSEEISTPGARQSPKRSGQSGSPAQANSTRKSRKSGNVGSEEISTPGARQSPKRFGQSGSPVQANSSRKSRKSGNVGSEEISTPGTCQSPKSSGNPAQANSSRKSRKSGKVGSSEISTPGARQSPKSSGSPVQLTSSRRSRKSKNVSPDKEISSPGACQTLNHSAAFVLETDSKKSGGKLSRPGIDERNISNRASRRSQSVLSDTTTQSSSARISRKSGIGSTGDNAEPTPTRSGSFTPKSDSKSSRLSQSQDTTTPTRSSSARNIRTSHMGGTEDNLEPIVSSTPQRLSQGEEKLLTQASRRSRSVPSGTPTQSSSSRNSRKSVGRSTEENSDPIVSPTPERFSLGEEKLPSPVTRRSRSVPSGSPTRSSVTRKSRNSGGMGNTEDNSEPMVPLTPKRLSQGEGTPSSRRVPPGSPTQLNSPRKSRKSDVGSPRESSKSIPKIIVLPPTPYDHSGGSFAIESDSKSSRRSQGDEVSLHRVPRRSRSGPSGSPAQMNLSRKHRGVSLESGNGSPEKVPSPKQTGTSMLNSDSKSSRLSQYEKSISSPPGKKRTSRNQADTSIARDIKPLLRENGSVAWPVTVPINTATITQFSEDVKPLSNPSTSTNISLGSPTARSPRKLRGSSARLDESASFDPSTSIANLSAIPRSSRTRVAFSTPAPSNSKQFVKVTSTPFPKCLLVSRWDGTQEVPSDSTLPIEIDTVNIHSSYISSDSPDYDRITDEDSFDVTDAPGTSARTSVIKKTPKVNSKRSVSFVAIKSGVKNRKYNTPPSKTATIKQETRSTEEVTPPNTSLEVNWRSSRKTSTAKKPSPSTPLTAGKTFRMKRAAKSPNPLSKSLSEGSLVKIVSPEKNLTCSSPLAASSLNNLTSAGARRSLGNSGGFIERNSLTSSGDAGSFTGTTVKVHNSPTTSRSVERNESPRMPISSISPAEITPPRTISPEVVLRSSRKSSRLSRQLSVPGTPTRGFKKNPRRSVKKASPSARLLKRKLDAIKSPGGSGIKKLKLDPDKPDKKKMAALWVCHKKKSPAKSPIMSKQNEASRSYDNPVKSPTKFNARVKLESFGEFKFQTSGSGSSSSFSSSESLVDTSGKSLTPIKDLDAQPQQLSPEDDLLNALDLSRKSDVVVEPQKPSRRLRSTTKRRTPAPGKASPSKSSKKLLFRSPLVDYEGSQPRGELQVNSSNIKSILIPSPTRSSDEPMSRVFTTSPVVDYTDSSGKKKMFRASPTSKNGGIRELIPSEDIDLTGVRDLFERTPSPTSVAPAAELSKKLGQKRVVVEDQDVSPPKVAKVSLAATSSKRKRGAPVELGNGAVKSTGSVVDESIQSTPPSPKSPLRKQRSVAAAQSTNTDVLPQQKTIPRKAKKVEEAKLETSFETPPRAKNTKTRANKQPVPASKRTAAPSKPKANKKVSRVSVSAATAAVRAKAVGSKHSKSIQVFASPKKVRSQKVKAAVKAPTSKDSPKKMSAPKSVPKEASKSKQSPKKSSPRKLRSKKVEAKETAVKASTSKESPKKASASKDSTEKSSDPKNGTKKASKRAAVKASTPKKSPIKASPKKLRSKKIDASKEAAEKAPTSKESRKKASAPKAASATKNGTPKASAKRATKTSSAVKAPTSKESPKKASNGAAAIASTSKKAAPKNAPKKASPKKAPLKSGSKSKSKATNSPIEKLAAAKAKTKKQRKSTSKTAAESKPRLSKVSPRKTRSVAKPKKPSPQKAALSGRKR